MTLEDLRKITEDGCWRLYAQLVLNDADLQLKARELFNTYWVEAGHHIRKQISDDLFLVQLLRHMLKPYEGCAVTLFRGESIERWEAGDLGFAWTSHIDVARMFGRGLNSIPTGGVLLKGHFDAKSIISGPNTHSRYLGEEQYTIDPFNCPDILIVEQFPRIPQ